MDRQTSVVIVTYNSAEYLSSCLESALSRSLDVVVVDNSSTDDTLAVAQRFPSAKTIANSRNAGFASAVNQGVRASVSDYILLLNPDAALRTGIGPLVGACSQPGTGAAAGKLVGEDGQPQRGFTLRRFPTPAALILEALGLNRIWSSNPVNRRYRCAGLDLTKSQFAEQPAGALLLFRRSLWTELGGFDERFHPLWFEDVDFLTRTAQKGYKIRYEPQVEAVHHGGHSIASLDPASRQTYWYGSLLRYSAKHFRPLAVRAIAAAILIGLPARIIVGLGRYVTGRRLGRSLDSGGSYKNVFRLAAASLWSGEVAVHVDGAENVGNSKLRNSHLHGL